jgi:3-isopropylmalate/(R)-2-methylmalate dehydratase small subunit
VQASTQTPESKLRIDLERQTVTGAQGQSYTYPLGARHKRMVIEGMDTIDLMLASLADIEAFERAHFARRAWAQVL